MTDEKTKKKWITKCKKSLETLLLAENGTIFDRFIFDDNFAHVVCEMTVKFEENEEQEFRVIRATRLKLLGYVWDKDKREWHFKGQPSLAQTK